MNCDRAKELLLTDFLDREADAQTYTEVQRHLAACPDCRRFEEEVLRNAVLPFKNQPQEEPPRDVWLGVRERITARKIRKARFPGPALTLMSACAAVFIIFAAVTKYNADKAQVTDYLSDQMDFFTALNNGVDAESDESYYAF
jgi:predicted anti-sigma-YlaC factor YlaD